VSAAQLSAVGAIGGHWTRTDDVKIDILGADLAPSAKELLFVGSVKWLENAPFDRVGLAANRERLTADPVSVIAVSHSCVDCVGLDLVYGPEELLAAVPCGTGPRREERPVRSEAGVPDAAGRAPARDLRVRRRTLGKLRDLLGRRDLGS
jgi:hypothetical protein